MEKKYRILFSVPAMYGHVAPSLAIAKKLIAEGHTVGYCCGSPVRKLLEDAGVAHFYPRDIFHEAHMKVTLVKRIYEFSYKMAKTFTPNLMTQCYHELLNAFYAFRPDIVYIDTYDNIAEAVAERFNLPYVFGSATVILYYQKGIPPVGTGWDINTPIRNRFKSIFYFMLVMPFILKVLLSQKKALTSIDSSWKQKNFTGISPYLYFLYSTDKIEYPREDLFPQIFYLGPSILEPDESREPDFPWEKLDKSKPLVYIATGTLFSHYYRTFYKNAVKALSRENFPKPIQVVMAMGSEDAVRGLGDIPDNIIAVRYAPQLKLLQKASIFVTHGGVNSVNESLQFGKPMLVVHCGMDRVDMGKRIEHIGAGLCISFQKASVSRIQKSILKILENPGYTKAAETVMTSFRRCNGPETAAGLIRHLAETRKPVLRKPSAPITLESIKDFQNHLL